MDTKGVPHAYQMGYQVGYHMGYQIVPKWARRRQDGRKASLARYAEGVPERARYESLNSVVRVSGLRVVGPVIRSLGLRGAMLLAWGVYAMQTAFLGTAMAAAAVALCDAAARGDMEQVCLLVSEGVDINVGDYDKRRAMHLAASEGHKEIVELLAGAGAELSQG